ncbi:ABC transporter permease [Microlunatus flavus]|uniref:Simple sugar transport system permease protein n=1 Tax=Microlunatus flavus TaxID=1036181 RepID=A0A1H9BZB6_9ACTN|nr:ABC transporter permease [Microlunatus flavus]SEP94107.1 simple sugar transport system permease protein [Microlunatus flavus]
MTALDPAPRTDAVVPTTTETVESPEKRRQRLSTGVLIAVVGVLLLVSLGSTTGVARFALSDAFDEVQLGTVPLPGLPTVAVCAVLCLLAAAAFLSGRVHGRLAALAATVAGLAVVIGFLTWAAAGRDLPFPVSNQFAGTLSLATPLVFGALCGVMCERAGVVNVSIEGQFLAAAFAAAVVGSVTQSVTWAILAAVVAGVAMAALLAVFSINYLVNQVVLGVVLNLLAVGVTGFLFDQLVQPAASTYNNAPVLDSIPIPGLSSIPFFGRVLFDQNILAYIAIVAVVVVSVVLYRTTFGLRVRSVGEHPQAADTVGISVRGVRWSAVLFGGVLAGLGGSFFTLASTGQFTKEFTVGNGFIALAALIMGRWRPVLATVMCLFFGFVTQMASQLQTLSTPMPSQLLLVLPYIATIIAVAGLVGRVRPPAADGVPYEK